MPEVTFPHATSAPDDLLKASGTAIDKIRKSEPKDEYGRIRWINVSRKMSEWWKEKGYSYP